MHRRSFASEGTSPKATRMARKRVRDRRAEAQPYKGMSQTKVKSRMYASKFPTERSPVAKCVMIAEANTDAPKSFCDAPDGTGHRDMARSESSARELGRPADAERSSLTFLGYEFRKVRDRLFGIGKSYLHFGPSPKSVKRVCQEVHKHTHSRNVLLPVDVVVDRVNKLLEGWGVSPALPARTRYVLIEIDDVSPNKLASIEEVEIQSAAWGD